MGFRQVAEQERDNGGQEDKRVYLDYAATAPIEVRLRKVIHQASWANPNALYKEGREAARQVDDSRKRIASALRAHAPAEVYFTSGGTESANTAIRGMANPVPGAAATHVVVSSVEHHAVSHAAAALKREGFKVSTVECGPDGVVRPEGLEALFARIEEAGDAVTVVAVQAVNNETGAIHPVRELAKVAHAHGALFYCDGVQGLGKVDIDLEASGVDAAGFSAHKLGGLKGSGLLYVRRGVKCRPLLYGGGQENGMRSGTTDTQGALVLASAVEFAVEEREQRWQNAAALRDKLLEGLEAGSYAHPVRPVLPQGSDCVPHIVSLVTSGMEGEVMVLRLDNAGISASAGSACSTGSLEPSHVLTAMGVPRDEAFGSLRISFGPDSTEGDVERLLAAMPDVLR